MYASSISEKVGDTSPKTSIKQHFRESHVSILVDILASNSSKWQEIGIALGLPYDLIKCIRTMHYMSPVVCLTEVLHEWVLGNRGSKSPTRENLKQALFSHTVNLGIVAANLDKALYECKVDLENKESAVPTKSIEQPSFLHCSPHTCSLDPMGSVEMKSRTVSTDNDSWLSKWKKVLMDVYLAQPEVPEDSWPPIGNEVYINLALIKSSKISSSEYCRYTIQGDIDDIMKDKESIEYDSMFEDLEGGACLLIEGRPGSGKTTLVHKVSCDWAKNKLHLQNIDLLFLVHLRHFFSDPDISIHDLLKYHYTNRSSVESIAQYAEQRSGEGLCFILDGLDEYTPAKSKMRTSVVFKLIRKEILPKAVVIVASRPSGSAKIRNVATKQVETLGFLKDEIKQYIDEYKFSSVDKADGLHSYLKHHPNVMHMCYLPLQSAMVCYLYDKMGSSLPRTETEMYTKFTIHTLLRLLHRNASNVYLTSVTELQEKEKKSFALICKLAFEKTTKSLQIIKHSEISESFGDFNSDDDSLGLITVDRVASIDGEESFYTFLHLTFQEYLAAYHIAHLKEDEQVGLIKEYGQNKVMQMVWKFYCGLADFSGEATKFTELLKSSTDLYRAQCAFESQQSILCNFFQSDINCLTFDSKFLNPADFTAIGYVLSNTAEPVDELVLNKCKFGEDGINALLKEALKPVNSIKCLRFHGGKCSEKQFEVMAFHLLKNLSSIKVLDLRDMKLGINRLKVLFSCMSDLEVLQLEEKQLQGLSRICDSNLRRISVSGMAVCQSIQDKVIEVFGLEVLMNSITNCPCIKSTNHEIRSEDMARLLDGILKHSVCTSLILTHCSLGNTEAKILGNMLKVTKTLKALVLKWNCIEDVGAKDLSDGLKYCDSLKLLDISWNEIGDTGAIDIVNATYHYQNFKCFLWNPKITSLGYQYLDTMRSSFQQNCNSFNYTDAKVVDEEIIALVSRLDQPSFQYGNLRTLKFELKEHFTKYLTDSLKHCSELQKLDFEGSKTFSVSVLEYLKLCPSLQTLNLRSIGFNSYSVRSIIDSITNCKNLTTIILDGNEISNDCATALAAGLKHYVSLHTLSLNRTNIGNDGVRALVSGLRNCSCLKHLHLDGNKITSNGASALAEGLCECNSLCALHLQQNKIDSEGAKAIFEGLKFCSSLNALHLQWNEIGFADVKALNCALRYCSNLHSVVLDGNGFGNVGVEFIAEGLMYCSNLQALHLDKNYIGSDGAKALAKCLKYCSNLQTLHLNSNRISSDGALAIAEGLKPCSNLHAVHLDGNGIGSEGAMAIAEGLKHYSRVHVLHLDGNAISSHGALALAEGLKHCYSLSALHLDGNGIGSKGAVAIAEGLQHCFSLYALHLDGNKIGNDGAVAIAEGLKHWSSLRSLHLDRNRISIDGARALSEGLKHCSTLQVLHFYRNRIGSSGAKALAEGLKHCNNLQALHFYRNGIGSDGAKAIAEGLAHCTSLQVLHCKLNGIGSSGAKALAEGLKHCNNLEALHLDQNRISSDGAMALAEVLKHCNSLQTLHLNKSKINSDGAKALAEGFKYCSNLHTLHLDLNCESVSALTEGIKHCTSLHTLHLDLNKVKFKSAMAFAEGVKHCNSLHTLHLNLNKVDSTCAKVLAEALKCCRIQVLVYNGISRQYKNASAEDQMLVQPVLISTL